MTQAPCTALHLTPAGPDEAATWLNTPAHGQWLSTQAQDLLTFFKASLNPAGGFYVLGYDGRPLSQTTQELHTTTRLVHSYALGHLAGATACEDLIDQGMAYLWNTHRDQTYGGYLWAVNQSAPVDDRKLAYGHVFVLLAGASAKQAGHPDADRLIADVSAILDQHFWEEPQGLFADEFNRDWTPFSTYRGMNANMHGVEALLSAFEATGYTLYLERAGKILSYFLEDIAPSYDLRLPEHYTANWQVDTTYSGNPMFRPSGTTPGHSFEMARLSLQHWDLTGRPDDGSAQNARALVYRALTDAWDTKNGGFVYTLDFDGTPAIQSRFWWPLCEAIGVLATLIKISPVAEDEIWYRRLWVCAQAHFIDPKNKGWFPEIDAVGQPDQTQFKGKPDIYHALQATMFPLVPSISDLAKECQKEEPLRTSAKS